MTKNEIIQTIQKSIENGKYVSIRGGNNSDKRFSYCTVSSMDNKNIYSHPSQIDQSGFILIDGGDEYYINLERDEE